MAHVMTWEDIPVNTRQQIRSHRGWYTFQGILYIVAGALAVILPIATALAVEILLGVLLLAGGISKVIASIGNGKRESAWSWTSAILAVLTGGLMLWHPWAGLAALSALVTVFLVFDGIAEIFFAFRFKPLSGWGWLLTSGIVSLLLGLSGIFLFPLLGMVYIGISVGVSLMIYGISLLTVVGRLGQGPRQQTAPA
ncbi:MAG TPA: DUF308 domain-containing protein [Gammaproteobacteria bacterium]|nr:DUF308 domain-containing protein [Gammaproteobacteria bacterium]